MKFTKLALACSFAFATMAAQAAPGDVGAIAAAAAVPDSNVIFFSGASAPDNFLASVIGGMFQPGFTSVTGIGDAVNYRAFVGTAAAGIPGITAGTPLILIKRSQGGSVFGVDPVAKAQLIRTLAVKSASCIEGANATTYTCPIVGTDPVGNTNGTGGAVPDIGVSDVEPALFKTPFNTENGTGQLTNAELTSLISLPVNQLMMGIVATNAVTATTNLSRSQFGGALAGKIDTWDTIENSTNGSPMVVCRRVNGSGTQASYNWFFTGFPCNAASSGFLGTPPADVTNSFGYDGAHTGTTLDPFIIDPTAGLTIVENSGSGDVRNCLSSAYYGVDHFVQGDSGKYYRVTFSGVTGTPVGTIASTTAGAPAITRGGPSKAIGNLSFDSFGNANSAFAYRPPVINGTTGAITNPNTYTFANDPSGLSNSGWSFRQLDGAGVFNGATQAVTAGPGTGISPSKTNLVNGKYDFVVELTMQRRNSLSALKTSFFNNLRTRLGATTNTTNVAFATLPDIASWATNPTTVNKFSRGGNTCAPLIAFPPL
jgi:hypothetical protein